MHSWCVESEKWVEICFHHWTSKKIPFLYFFLHKSWIWRTLGHVTKKNSYRHFHNASKECFWPKNFLNFMHGFKSAILAKMTNCRCGMLLSSQQMPYCLTTLLVYMALIITLQSYHFCLDFRKYGWLQTFLLHIKFLVLFTFSFWAVSIVCVATQFQRR